MIPRLGIVVLYVVPGGYEGMLDLHLRQIERHTRVPYTIYGAAVRCAAGVADRLRLHPRVRLVPVAPSEGRGSSEHSHYLDQLVACAIDDGVAHVVVLHLDSFPIHDHWVEGLLRHVSPRCPLVTGEGIDVSCMAFTREFYLACRPMFLPPPEVQAGADFARCVSEWRLVPHSGVGYAFAAYRDGFTARFLPARRRADSVANTYESMVFHLGGGLRSLAPPAPAGQALRLLREWVYRAGGRAIRAVSTPRFRALTRRRIGAERLQPFDQARSESERLRVRQEMAELLANPNQYLASRWG